MKRTPLLLPFIWFFSACAPDAETTVPDCDVASGATSLNSDTTNLTVRGTVLSRCTVARVDIGSWSGTVSMGTAGQEWSATIPLVSLQSTGAGAPAAIVSDCPLPEGVSAWGMGADGSVTLPVEARLFDNRSTCLDPVTWTGGTGSAGPVSLTLDPEGPAWLPESTTASLKVTAEADRSSAGTTVSWSALGGGTSNTASVFFESSDCPSGAVTCAISTAMVTANNTATAVNITVMAGTGSGVTGMGQLSIPVFGPPTFTVTGNNLAPGESVEVRVHHDVALADVAWTGALTDAGWTFGGGQDESYPVSATSNTPSGASVTFTAMDDWGQSATQTVTLSPSANELALASSAEWLPATDAAPFEVVATADQAGVGQAISWTVTGGSSVPTSATLLPSATCPGDGCAATATATVVPTSGAATVVVTATVGSVSSTRSIPVVAAPTIERDVASLVRGADAVATLDVRTDGVLEHFATVGCSPAFHVEAAGCLSASCSLGESDVLTVSIDPDDETSTATDGVCTVQVYDAWGQASTATVTLEPAPLSGAFTTSLSTSVLPDDGLTALTWSFADVDESLGTVLTLEATNGTLGSDSLTLDRLTATNSGASTSFASNAPGDITLSATSGGTVYMTTVQVVAAPDVTDDAVSIEAAKTEQLLFTADHQLSRCTYTGGTFWADDGTDVELCPDSGCGASDVVVPADGARSVLLTVAAPGSTAFAWCEDPWGRRALSTVTLK